MVDEEKHPLWLPKGSVRAILALTIVFTLCGLVVFKIELAKDFAVIAGMVVAFYFATKNGITSLKAKP